MSYNSLPQYELPEVDYSSSGNRPPQQPQQFSRRRGCLLLSPVGCLMALCLGAVACVCLVFVGPIVGFGAVIAVFLTNRAEYSSVERIDLEAAERISLSIDDPNAKITLIGSSENVINIDYKITTYGYSEGNARTKLNDTTLEVERQADGTFRIFVDDEGIDLSIYDLNLTITLPVQLSRVTLDSTKEIYIEDVEADFVIRSSDDIFMADVVGSFDVEVTSLANLIFRGTPAPSTRNRFVTSSGRLETTFQGKTNFIYTAQTTSGTITCPDNLTGNTCTGRYGDATAKIDLTSVSGDVVVQIRQNP